MRGDWLFSEAAIAPDQMTRLVAGFQRQLQSMVSPGDVVVAQPETQGVEDPTTDSSLKPFSSRALFGSTE